MKKLLRGIDPNKRQLKEFFTHRNRNGLFLPDAIVRDLDEYCRGCGEAFKGRSTEMYYGEHFCKACVDKWKSGHE